MRKTMRLALALMLGSVPASGIGAAPVEKEKAVSENPNIAVVKQMIAAWDARDANRIADLFTEDGVLHSMMIEPIKGRENIRPRMAFLVDNASYMEIKPRNFAVVGNTVFLERTDNFTFKGHSGSVPVVGVLEIEGGKVKEWREYYDRAKLLEAMGVKENF